MTYFKYIVLSQIKSAADEKEVKSVVELSILRLKSRNINGHVIQRFIVAMDKILDAAKRAETSENVLQNVDTAIQLFRNLHRG
jgi:hypothetical protein